MSLFGISLPSLRDPSSTVAVATLSTDYQEVRTTVESGQHNPHVVQKGVPGWWIISARAVALKGCSNPLSVPQKGGRRRDACRPPGGGVQRPAGGAAGGCCGRWAARSKECSVSPTRRTAPVYLFFMMQQSNRPMPKVLSLVSFIRSRNCPNWMGRFGGDDLGIQLETALPSCTDSTKPTQATAMLTKARPRLRSASGIETCWSMILSIVES
jgi:hypothetical protein